MKNAKKLNTNIVGPPRPGFKWGDIQEAVGKSIESIDFGEEKSSPLKHESEAIIFHFTDGTSMSIVIGSNASNLIGSKVSKASDVHTDIMIFWDTN
jgi:hypothetical protein